MSTNTFDAMCHALKPLDAITDYRARKAAERARIEAAKPCPGLDAADHTFARHAEDYDHVHVFDYTVEGPGPGERGGYVDITGCTLVGNGVKVELPISMFHREAIDMVREEIEVALMERAERLHFSLGFERRQRMGRR